jgi:hypothetical protein
MFDQDNDTRLSEHELELLHAAMFPEFGILLLQFLAILPSSPSPIIIWNAWNACVAVGRRTYLITPDRYFRRARP